MTNTLVPSPPFTDSINSVSSVTQIYRRTRPSTASRRDFYSIAVHSQEVREADAMETFYIMNYVTDTHFLVMHNIHRACIIQSSIAMIHFSSRGRA